LELKKLAYDYKTGAKAVTTWEFFEGKAMWAELRRVNAYGKFKVVLYPKPASLKRLMELKDEGMMNHIKTDEEGSAYINLSRPPTIKVAGKDVPLPLPEILKADGITPLNDDIGNGSDVVVKCEVRRYKNKFGNKGIAVRLASVRVDNLVPYNAKRDFNEDQKKAIEGLSEQPNSID
jgi:hypothetical protein